MARSKSVASLSIDALVKLRDDIGEVLSRRAGDLRRQLSLLTGSDIGARGSRRRRRASSLKGRRVPAKYRSKKDPKLTWAGRGAMPLWMRTEMKSGRLKREAFLIK